MNRAVQDDIVAIELLPKSEWSCPSSLALVDDGEKGDDSVKKEVGLLRACAHLAFALISFDVCRFLPHTIENK